MKNRTILAAEAVALEHMLWAARQGLSPSAVLHGFGLAGRHANSHRWGAVLKVLAREYRRLTLKTAASSPSGAGRIPQDARICPPATAIPAPSPPVGS